MKFSVRAALLTVGIILTLSGGVLWAAVSNAAEPVPDALWLMPGFFCIEGFAIVLFVVVEHLLRVPDE